jgi:hypothetical protein
MTCKSKTFALAVAIMSVVLVSLAPASAAPVVRDHREKPIVRDHRGAGSGGGVTVTNSSGTRKPGIVKKHYCVWSTCF